MSTAESNLWTRRRLLQVIPAALASAMIANGRRTLASYPTSTSAFSSFLDVAASAGLTQTMFYGEAHKATYIIEIMGAGCAFFDLTNLAGSARYLAWALDHEVPCARPRAFGAALWPYRAGWRPGY